MKDNALVSVITIFLNAGRFIEEAIESVLAQTYDRWELLLVDDGSTDESTAIARRYAARYPEKMRYLDHASHQNRGMSASRNLGVRQAWGDHVAFLDADDVWLPRMLERQVAILGSQPQAALVYGATRWWYSWTGKPEDRQRDFVHDLGVPADTLVPPPRLLPLFLRDEGASPCTCSVLVRREAFERVGGFEEAFRGMYEDQAFFAKVCLKAPVYVSSECWSQYRQHSGSCVSAAQEKDVSASRRQFLTWLEGYLSGQGIDDAGLWRALRESLTPYRHPLLHRVRRLARRFPGRGVPAVRLRRTTPVPGSGVEASAGTATPDPPSGVGALAATSPFASRFGLVSRLLGLPAIRRLRCLQFRRLEPLGKGRQRGTPIVRYYWARFLHEHQADIRGRGLEVGTTATLRQYGSQALAQADAIDLERHSPEVTVVADLSRADSLPADVYDCFVNQFTLHLIFDLEAALYHSLRILKPGGVLLANFPCLDYYFAGGLNMGTGGPLFLHWWLTPLGVENLLRRLGLAEADYQLAVYGNLFARIAYQLNLPAEELTQRERQHTDPGHPLLICVRVVKPAGWRVEKPEYRDPWLPSTVPARWNPVTGHYAR